MTIHRFDFPDSTMLANCEYNTTDEELAVTFNNGRTYIYKDVPYSTYEALINSQSAGKYFNSIKKELVLK